MDKQIAWAIIFAHLRAIYWTAQATMHSKNTRELAQRHSEAAAQVTVTFFHFAHAFQIMFFT